MRITSFHGIWFSFGLFENSTRLPILILQLFTFTVVTIYTDLGRCNDVIAALFIKTFSVEFFLGMNIL